MKNEILKKVKAEKAKEFMCNIESFSGDNNIFITSNEIIFKMITFGRNTVVIANNSLMDDLKSLLENEEGIFCFDAPLLSKIDHLLSKHKSSIGEIYDFFLPRNIEETKVEFNEKYEVRKLTLDEVKQLDKKQFENSICEDIELTKITYAAFDNNKIVSVAGSSSNSEKLWWVGVDTLPGYRNQGLATYLVSKVRKKVLSLGKIPAYATWYSNIGSRKTALDAGFTPGFVEISTS